MEIPCKRCMCRNALGVYIYASIAYPQLVMPNSVLCKRAANPHDRTARGNAYMYESASNFFLPKVLGEKRNLGRDFL